MGINAVSIDSFFNSFEMDEDKRNGHYYKSYMKQTILEFMKSNSHNTAYDVYTTFFDCYRIKVAGSRNFIDLLDTLKAFEENASILLDKQRDHYIHSVNVFILGIAIFSENIKFQKAIEIYLKNDGFTGKFDCSNEEFFFRWGIASLFHDIGYPVEITNNQIKKFMQFVVSDSDKSDAKPFIGYGDFGRFNHIEGPDFASYRLTAKSGQQVDCANPLNLLSYSIHAAFDVEYEAIKNTLDNFLPLMQKFSFVDHGYYSAITVLHWYGHLIQESGQPIGIFYHSVLDAASAILLHNYYKNGLQKEPFHLGPMKAEAHPIAYLLILCDELQEWNRTAYGILDKQKVLAADCNITLGTERLDVHFITFEGTLSEDFAIKKEETFHNVLDIDGIFAGSIHISATTKTEQYIEKMRKEEALILPRPFIEQVEQVAKRIHENYNKEQLAKYPDKPLEYPAWRSLPDDLKYSNVQQARGYFDKLKLVGYVALSQGNPDNEVYGFTKEQLEQLARQEHDRWCDERIDNGWSFGPVKDVKNKKSPYIIPYDELPEEIKELDRNAVKGIFPLLLGLGLKVYRG